MSTSQKDPYFAPEIILRDAVYLTDEAATLCRSKPSTIRAAVRTGRIRATGRPFRILGSELIKLVKGVAS